MSVFFKVKTLVDLQPHLLSGLIVGSFIRCDERTWLWHISDAFENSEIHAFTVYNEQTKVSQ